MSDNKKLLALRATAEEKVKAYNDAIQSGNFADSVKFDDELTQAINEYTAEVRKMCFDECKASGTPMLTAVTMLSFMTIGTKDEKVGDDKVPVRVIVEKERAIDLFKLHKYIDGGIGHDKNWLYIAEKFNALLTVAAAQDIGMKGPTGKPITPKEICDSYAMSAIAREIDLGKAPTSDTAMLKQLQVVIAAMIGEEYKVTTHDLKFLKKVYTRKSRKALTVTTANHKYLRGYLAEICHKLVTGKHYDGDWKKVKE